MDFLGANCTMSIWNYNRLLKNTHLLRFPCLSSLRRTPKYASLLRTSGALQLGVFEQPGIGYLSSDLMNGK
jgi:hypothetical protein